MLALGPVNVVTGPNGSGKSSLYRALRLLADVAQGRIIQALAAEGGLDSTLWAGPEALSRADEARPAAGRRHGAEGPGVVKLGFAGDDYGYAIDLGLPASSASAFSRDPAIKCESVWNGETLGRANAFAVRHGPSVRIRDDGGSWRQAYDRLASFDSMMTHCSDPGNGLELLLLRERLRDWRFYDHFRTDIEAPARRPQVGTYTPVLASDGADLAAATQTIREIGDGAALDDAVADAFDGARIDVTGDRGYLELEMRQHGLLRSLKAGELSDGTLRYLLLVSALLSPHPPTLMILNEPETSLHQDLLAPWRGLLLVRRRDRRFLLSPMLARSRNPCWRKPIAGCLCLGRSSARP